MKQLIKCVSENEEWLINRILDYSRRQGYADYSSTRLEDWHLFVSGLSSSMVSFLKHSQLELELRPDQDFSTNPAVLFSVTEARLHRKRGVTLAMFLGLMKYYRQGYEDLIYQTDFDGEVIKGMLYTVKRFFDQIEIAFCDEWTQDTEVKKISEPEDGNRSIINEKNKFQTIFESLPKPVLVVDRDNLIENINSSAFRLFQNEGILGSEYYRDTPIYNENKQQLPSRIMVNTLFPWLADDFLKFSRSDVQESVTEKAVETKFGTKYYMIKFSRMIDVSGKFRGSIIILDDISETKRADIALWKKEQFVGAILDSIQDGISVLNPDFTIVRVNRTMEKWYSHMLPLEGKKCYEAYHGRTRICENCPAERALITGKIESEELQLRELSGTSATLELFAFPMLDNFGKIVKVVNYLRDVTERKQAEEALKERDQHYRALFENNHSVMMIIDPETADILDVNSAACTFYGYSMDTFKTMKITDMNMLSEQEIFREMDCAKTEKRTCFYFRHTLADGRIRDVEVYSGPIRVKNRSLLYSVVHDVTDRKLMEKKLIELSTTDYLTGISNRYHFYKKAKKEFRRFLRYKNPMSVMLLDIDHFKKINDYYGHHAGDQVLREMSEVCLSIFRKTDIFGRIGGEEFACILLETNLKKTLAIAERLRNKIEELPVILDNDRVNFTVSIGLTSARNIDISLDMIMKRVDKALYQAKDQGRNQVVNF